MDRQQENNDRQKSSVDRVNQIYDNALRLRRTYKKTRGLRTAVNAFRAARAGTTVAQGAGAVAGGISGGTAAAIIFLILLIIFLIIMIFVVIFGGNQNVNAGTPPECTTVGGTCSSQTTCSDVSNSQPDTTGATCTDATTPTCCVPLPPPPSGTGCNALGRTTGGVVCWAKEIYDVLQPALGCAKPTYNRLQTIITNGSYSTTKKRGDCNQGGTYGYLCTDLVIDSNNLAGIRNHLSRTVGYMIYQWSSVNGLVLQNTNNVQNVRPGDAVFWFSDMPPQRRQGYHTDVVYKKDISSSGNGYLYTLDSNVVGAKLIRHSVVSWKIRFSAWAAGSFGYAWFGLHN